MPAHTTTIRFDADTWGGVGRHAERFGMSRGEFVRNAVVGELARREAREQLAAERPLGDEVELIKRRIEVLTRHVARIETVLATHSTATTDPGATMEAR
jgi:hypothetical protein